MSTSPGQKPDPVAVVAAGMAGLASNAPQEEMAARLPMAN